MNEVKSYISSLERPVTLSFARQVVAGDVVDDDVVDDENVAATQGSQPGNDVVKLTQQSPLTGSSSSRLGSQPSQLSAGSQISPGIHSPNLLESQQP